MAAKVNNIITLTIADSDIRFEPNMTAYHAYINDMAMDNKIQPSHNYLRRIVVAEDKAKLDELLALPGAVLAIVNAVNEEYAPKLEISIKN